MDSTQHFHCSGEQGSLYLSIAQKLTPTKYLPLHSCRICGSSSQNGARSCFQALQPRLRSDRTLSDFLSKSLPALRIELSGLETSVALVNPCNQQLSAEP